MRRNAAMHELSGLSFHSIVIIDSILDIQMLCSSSRHSKWSICDSLRTQAYQIVQANTALLL